MVLSSWQSHCESSPGSFDECRMAPSGRRPKTKPDDLGCESACTGCQKLHPPSPLPCVPLVQICIKIGSLLCKISYSQVWYQTDGRTDERTDNKEHCTSVGQYGLRRHKIHSIGNKQCGRRVRPKRYPPLTASNPNL